jgi:hypothetical protein
MADRSIHINQQTEKIRGEVKLAMGRLATLRAGLPPLIPGAPGVVAIPLPMGDPPQQHRPLLPGSGLPLAGARQAAPDAKRLVAPIAAEAVRWAAQQQQQQQQAFNAVPPAAPLTVPPPGNAPPLPTAGGARQPDLAANVSRFS